MEVFNLFADDWDAESSRPGYSWRRAGVAARLGGELIGASHYELPPGERTWPYHFERGNEEWLIALAGRPTLRTPDGERELARGEIVCFPRGPAGAHQVINRSDGPARVLILSTKLSPEVVEYPDSGKIGVWRDDGTGLILRADATTDYWEGE